VFAAYWGNIQSQAHLEKAIKRNQFNDEIRKLRIDLQRAQDRSTKAQNSVDFFTSGEMNLQQPNELFPKKLLPKGRLVDPRRQLACRTLARLPKLSNRLYNGCESHY
jgi:hypothetical protein